ADDPGCHKCVSEAASLFARGKSREAVDLLKEWTDRCPHSSQLHLLLSTILMRTNKLEDAEIEAGKAAAVAPDLVAAHLQYGLTLMANAHHAKAAREFERVTELDP